LHQDDAPKQRVLAATDLVLPIKFLQSIHPFSAV